MQNLLHLHPKSGQAGTPVLRPNHIPTSAASATSARKPFTATKTQGGIRDTSTRGGGTPGSRWRHTAASKQNALNKTRTLPVARINHCGRSFALNMPRPPFTHAGIVVISAKKGIKAAAAITNNLQ